jgi:hypothetical protein
MRFTKRTTMTRKKSINRKKLTKGGYDWRRNPTTTSPSSPSMKKKNKKLRYKARGTKKNK